ncbi:MAG: type I methionyl aminopeptidase [Candidatus Moraniibacteriota bacterium]|nr:MAG: type I methionyl aminopeptidase [Candidatus Moranbacteria bacterium]
MRIKTPAEIEKMREGGKRLHDVLLMLLEKVRPGISTYELDVFAFDQIKKIGGKPSFLYYGKEFGNPYPATVCISLNEEVVHGIPSKEKIVQEGDLISLDIGMWFEGLATDTARTIIVGKSPSKRASELVEATKESLYAGIETFFPGSTLRDYAYAVENIAKKGGFSVVRDLIGHGVGHAVHEAPDIANYVAGSSREKVEEGMVLALEPMFTLGTWKVRELSDGWTFSTADGSLSAHFEDTVAITKNGFEILT